MPDLVVVVPSRGRPEAVAELARTCQRTCTADTALLVVVDTDDPTLAQYTAPAGTTVFFAWAPPASGHVGAINYGAARAVEDLQPFAVAKLDDDHRPRTKGWDARLLEALHELGTGIAYGNDLYQGANLPTAPAITADIVQALGYMAPPSLVHLCLDLVWMDWGRGMGRITYLGDVVIEHMHPAIGKAAMDAGYQECNSSEQATADATAYYAYRDEGGLEADLAKLKTLVEEVA
jgi:hypothetical protein